VIESPVLNLETWSIALNNQENCLVSCFCILGQFPVRRDSEMIIGQRQGRLY
jgi:hypothetical protein